MAASRHFLRKVWAVPATRLCVSNQRRTITQNSIRCFASTKEEAPELPNGFLFNEKPLLPGEKRQKESWENIWIIGMFGNILLAGILYYFKPDTYPSTLARKEAERRIAEGGEPPSEE